jgi:sugar phosphate isomerase/epimerase
MKLGFVSAILPELSFQEVIEFASLSSFDCVEIMCWPVGKAERKYAGVTHIDVVNLSQKQIDEIKSTCEKNKVFISGLGYYPNPLDPDAQVSKSAIDHIKKVILAAEKLGLTNVNTFIGRDWTKTVDENWPQFIKIWKPLVKFAEDHNVKIGIENCPMLFSRDEWPGGKNLATTPVIWRRIFNDIPSNNLGLNFDPSHLILQHMDPIKPLSEFKNKIFHIHAKDVLILKDKKDEHGIFDYPLTWHQPRIPGFGDINWSKFMAELYRINYNGPVCIEVEDDTFGKSLDGRKLAIKVAGNILRPFFGC